MNAKILRSNADWANLGLDFMRWYFVALVMSWYIWPSYFVFSVLSDC